MHLTDYVSGITLVNNGATISISTESSSDTRLITKSAGARAYRDPAAFYPAGLGTEEPCIISTSITGR